MREKNKKKKIALLLIFLALLILILIPSTYAWFFHISNKINKFTTGEIKHEILENFKITGPALDILPGEIINKDVFIHNTAKSDALLRVKITPIWIDSNGNSTPVDENDITLIFAADVAANWTKGTDGYYYYNTLLKAHDLNVTHPVEGSIDKDTIPICYSKQLLDGVKLNESVTDQSIYANRVFDVLVQSETIQVNISAAKDEWNINNDANILNLITKIVNEYTLKR